MSAAEQEFRNAAIRQERCAGCGPIGHGPLILDLGHAHHAIPRSSLTKLFPDRPELEWDPRNAVLLCELCHARHHVRFLPMARERLPEPVFEFAAELEITWLLEKLYPAAEAAA